MGIFEEEDKPRTARAAARQREKKLIRKLSELLETDDEGEFTKALEEDFDIRRGDKRFEQILKIWRAEHSRAD